MARVAARHKAARVHAEDQEETKQDILTRKLEESEHAFMAWETAQNRTDQQLYQAIGRLAEFAAAVGNDHETLIELGKERDIRATKASNVYAVVTKMVVTRDRRKASKYATVLQFAARRGIEANAEKVADFIRDEGGIEACLRAFRELPREASAHPRRGRPSAYGKAVGRVAELARTKAPDDLRVAGEGEYVLIVGVRGADGSLQLIQKPIEDEKMIRKAITVIAASEAT